MSARLPFRAVSLAVLCVCQGGWAQEAADGTLDPVSVDAPATPFRQLLGVEVTGTAIINPKARERLPLTVIERRDIERSGATSLLQVLEGLSMAHNSTDEGQMITATGGAISVGLRGEPNSTLVLLNGVRLPNYAQSSLSGEASSVHLRLIPLIAVERIEVLREGASTLYGSDAVAGVVNIITRTDVQGLNIRARQGLVAGGLGNQDNLELSWGKGRFERDGYQVLAAVGLNKGRALLGSDRPTAWWPKTEMARDTTAFYTWPGTVWDSRAQRWLPNSLYKNGVCEGEHLYSSEELGGAASGFCFFDRTSLGNVYPVEESTNVLLQGRVSVGRDQAAFVEHAASRSNFTFNKMVNPNIMFYEAATTNIHYLSTLPAGPTLLGRKDEFERTVVGLQGQVLGHSYKAFAFDGQQSTSKSVSRLTESAYLQGFLTSEELNTPASELSETTLNKLRRLHRSMDLSASTSQIHGLQAQVSGQWEHTDGLESQYAVAVGWRQEGLAFESLDGTRSAVSNDRSVSHVLGEWSMPVNEALTVALGARADRYSDAGSANTAKVSARYKASDQWMWRGALGNGFRAPGLMLTSTVDDEVATFPASAYSMMRPVKIFNQGNAALKPEKSQHLTLGTQYTSNRWAFAMDWWALNSSNLVYIHDSVNVLVDRDLYSQFVRELPAGTANPTNALGMYLQPQNLGRRDQQGIDYQVQYRHPLDSGVVRLDWTGSWNLQSRFKAGNAVINDLGKYTGETGRYTPRHKWALSAMYEPKANLSHRLTLNYLSGNEDIVVAGFPSTVPSHWSLDWHTHFAVKPGVTLGVGIVNITDRIPPRRMSNSRQSASGVDTRYGDFRGRTLTLSLDAKF